MKCSIENLSKIFTKAIVSKTYKIKFNYIILQRKNKLILKTER